MSDCNFPSPAAAARTLETSHPRSGSDALKHIVGVGQLHMQSSIYPISFRQSEWEWRVRWAVPVGLPLLPAETRHGQTTFPGRAVAAGHSFRFYRVTFAKIRNPIGLTVGPKDELCPNVPTLSSSIP